MTFISRLVYVFNTLSGCVPPEGNRNISHKPALHHKDTIETPETKQPPRAKPQPKRVEYSPEFVKNHTLLDFDLPEALRLRALGWGNRRIARQMNNIGKDTVRTRLKAYDERQNKQPVIKQPSIPPSTPHTDSHTAVPTVALPDLTPPSARSLTVPEPVTNLAELAARRRAHGLTTPLDLTHVFLTRPDHVKYGLGSEQPVIGFDHYRDEYRALGIFQPPTKFYVLVNAEDGSDVNSEWLASIASDIWLRERCLVHRITMGGALGVFQSRYGDQKRYPVRTYGAGLADQTFEQTFKFVPCPQSNQVELLSELTKDVPPANGGYSQMPDPRWTSPQPMPPAQGYLDSPRKEESAGGLVTG